MKERKQDKEITPPNIPEGTMEEMKQFFSKTSIPRIMEARAKEKSKKGK